MSTAPRVDGADMHTRRLQQLLADLQRLALSEQGAGTPIAEAIDQYRRARLHVRELKPRTVAEYDRTITAFLRHVGDVSVQQLQHEHVRSFLDQTAEGSLNCSFSGLSACLRWLDHHGYPGLADLVPRRRPTARQRTRYLSDREYGMFFAAVDKAERERVVRPRMADLLRLAALVPLRRSEHVSLRWEHIDIDLRLLALPDSKTGPRILPVSRRAIEILDYQPRCSGYVWPPLWGRRAKHIGISSLSHAYAKVVRRLAPDLADTCLHGLRHSWASKAIREGVPLELVRRILGHSTQWMAARYAHLTAVELFDAVELVDKKLRGDV